jgi:hypothetical protein
MNSLLIPLSACEPVNTYVFRDTAKDDSLTTYTRYYRVNNRVVVKRLRGMVSAMTGVKCTDSCFSLTITSKDYGLFHIGTSHVRITSIERDNEMWRFTGKLSHRNI